jgi:hypothetical protein
MQLGDDFFPPEIAVKQVFELLYLDWESLQIVKMSVVRALGRLAY